MKSNLRTAAELTGTSVSTRLADIHATEQRVARETAAELARLKSEREALNLVRHPLHAMLEKIAALKVKIDLGESRLAICAEHDAIFRKRLDAAFCVEYAPGFFSAFEIEPEFVLAERVLRELKVWIAARRAELQLAQDEARDYATAHGLTDHLPVAAN